jgi:hypothetical protein
MFADTKRSLIVELTERIDDYEAVRAALKRLGPNVKLAIDDAGSGFASLRHIFALQPAYVKLDIEWVRGIDRDPFDGRSSQASFISAPRPDASSSRKASRPMKSSRPSASSASSWAMGTCSGRPNRATASLAG